MRILYLDLDTLRPDHLGCYGYCRNTSPNIDAVAKEGVRFENFYCSDAPCLPSRAALATGQFGIHTGVVGHGGTAADMRLIGSKRDFRSRRFHTSYVNLLRKAGLYPVLASTFAERHSAYWFYSGFMEIFNAGKGGMESAEDVTPWVLNWIEQNGKKDNWYLHVNYWDAHTPYRTPLEFVNPFQNEPLPEWITEDAFRKHLQHVGPHSAQELNMYNDKVNPKYPRHLGKLSNMNDLRKFIDGYDCGVRYMDEHIGKIFDALRKSGVWDNLIIIITSDHAENIGELGLYGEHATADYCTCRIPMIIRWPDKTFRVSADYELHYLLDLLPTMADLLRVDKPPEWDGQSFARTIEKGEPAGHDYLVLSQCAHVCQRAVRFGDWLWIRTYHDGYHLFPNQMLFNLREDPHEQTNLAEKEQNICNQAQTKLAEWHVRMMATMPEGYDTDPLWTVIKEGGPYHARGRLAQYCKRLEATGRGWAIPELMKRHPREFEESLE